MSNPITSDTLSYRRADNGIVFITIDVKDRPLNVLTLELHRDIGRAAEQLKIDDEAIGAVIHSAKSSFLAGGDLNRIVHFYDMNRSPEEAYAQSRTYTESLRTLETCGKPVAVAINGTALGGGLELALACHYRVVANDPSILLGLPEVTLGLLPGGGGTQRLPRLIGLEQAASLILSGRRLSPVEALELGLVDQIVDADALLQEAAKWVLHKGNPQQAWDRKGFRIPGGSGLNDMDIGRLFQRLTVRVSTEHKHNYPAPIAALRCLFNGTTVSSMDTALKIETREFSALTRDPVARNMIRTLFINKKKADRRTNRSGARSNDKPGRIAVIGDPGEFELFDSAFEYCEIAAADFVIVQDSKLGQLSMLAKVLAESAIVVVACTDLSADEITSSGSPATQIIGLCIGKPSQKSRVAEIIVSDHTSELTIERVQDLCRRMRKTPTLQKESTLLFSRRCQNAYMKEGLQMLSEGISPALIKNLALAAGMPISPLAQTNGHSPNVQALKSSYDGETLKQRFLCVQALTAAEFWQQGRIEAADADLVSVLGWGFPSYTGGVMSYIDTLGFQNFITLCDGLADNFGEALRPSAGLHKTAATESHIYRAE